MSNLACVHYQWGIGLHALVRTVINELFESTITVMRHTGYLLLKEIVSTIVQTVHLYHQRPIKHTRLQQMFRVMALIDSTACLIA